LLPVAAQNKSPHCTLVAHPFLSWGPSVML